jgi:hypothetical protein
VALVKITVRKVQEPTEFLKPDDALGIGLRTDSEIELDASLDEIVKVATALEETNKAIKLLIGEEVDVLSWFRSHLPFWPI